MSTGQQLGLIGNSVRVQSLPTASAATFGAGNRFYTLIGQQEGYITGHTYRTVVANDVYSWEDVAGGSLSLIKHEIDFKKENFYEIFDLLVSGNIISAYGLFKFANDSKYRYAGNVTANYPWIWMQAESLSSSGWEYFAVGISMSSTDGRYGVYPKTNTTVKEVQEAKLIYYTQG